ncbi:DgaE family pyridoxal phosphate-dependent ammonia lyase [Fusobacterium sp.]|uniref:DgaE family pyridoxal phosphate-dependent ammonia lyase n=1 Tax=Fusobacterium sp. TaxID=68766 RepID=UPI0025B8340F|nr:DgaE family pyridoxal phosphate-dependent ammonia lyase [Fusobacterium sp.]
MNIYEKIGLKRVINGSGKMTALGVSKVSDTVVETMKEAGQNFVVIDDLIDRVGELISKITDGEDTCVTSSASAAIALTTAGLITGENISLVERMPDSTGLKNKIILQKGHSVNFGAPITTMIRLGGGVPVEVGYSNEVKKEHIEEAIDDKVVGLLYVKSHHSVQKGMLSIEEMAEIAHKYSLPLIIDAAAEEDIKKYLKLGGDLVIYSGAKALCGPASGFVTGKKEYIKAIKLQYKGIGRAMKIGKMCMMGVLKAVEEYSKRDENKIVEEQIRLANLLIKNLDDENKVSTSIVKDEAGREIYRVQISLNKELTNISGKEFMKQLQQGEVEIHVRKHYANLGIINVDMRALTEQDIEFIAKRIKEILK